MLGMLYVDRAQSSEPLHLPPLDLFMAVIAVSSEFVAVLALLPTIPLIVYSERRGMRSFWFYAIAGALIGPVSFLLLTRALAHSFVFPGWETCLLTAFSGLFGGLIYWLMAGRSAGIRPTRATLQARS